MTGRQLATKFTDTIDEGGTLETPPFDNIIDNARLQNAYVGVGFVRDMDADPDTRTDTSDSLIPSSPFRLTRYMFSASRPVQEMHYADTVFRVSGGVSDPYFRGGADMTDRVRSQFDNCTVVNIVAGLSPGW